MIREEGIAGIPGEKVDLVWDKVELLFEELFQEDWDHTLEDIRLFCKEGKMQLWLVVGDNEICGVGITEILNFPRRRVLSIPYLAGFI